MRNARIANLLAGFTTGLLMLAPVQNAHAVAYNSPVHVFSIDDVQGGFNGSTFGAAGAVQDTSILCNAPGSSAGCPAGVAPITSPKLPPGAGSSPALYPRGQ